MTWDQMETMYRPPRPSLTLVPGRRYRFAHRHEGTLLASGVAQWDKRDVPYVQIDCDTCRLVHWTTIKHARPVRP